MTGTGSPRDAMEAFLGRCVDQALGREKADLVVKDVKLLNVVTGAVTETDIAVTGDRIVGTYEGYSGRREIDGRGLFAAPGFIDSHVHTESTLVVPAEFDRCVLPRGTTTAISDPHEICNVLGAVGLEYMIESASRLAMDLKVQLSSCVPATGLETSGARLEAADLVPFRGRPQVLGLAEFMNMPGVLAKDPGVMAKLAAFQDGHIDGHAPLLSGRNLNAYLATGIRTCHETTTLPEAREKLAKGMQLLIRDGTVSKDCRRLAAAITPETSAFCGFCTDDRNPLDIAEEGHLDHVIRTAIAAGAPMVHAYRAATWGAAQAFGLRDRGLVAPGRRADIVLLSDLEHCRVEQVIAGGRVVDDALFEGRLPPPDPVGLDSVHLAYVSPELFRAPASGPTGAVIGIRPGSIITDALSMTLPYRDGKRLPDPGQDVLKVAVLCRHGVNHNVGRGFVRGFGIVSGALASSVGHDSHNLCVVGAGDADMAVAANRLIEIGGGFVAVKDGAVVGELALPIAGLMSRRPFEDVRHGLERLRAAVRAMGCPLPEPFLQLAFLPLPVIPHLKITDLGVVDVDRFELVPA
jgi:adenine deaminase